MGRAGGEESGGGSSCCEDLREKNAEKEGLERCWGLLGEPPLDASVMRRCGVGRVGGAGSGIGSDGGCGGCGGGLEKECLRSFSSFHCCRRAGETKPSFLLSQRGLVRGGGTAVMVVRDGVDGEDDDDDGEETCDGGEKQIRSNSNARQCFGGGGSAVSERLCLPTHPHVIPRNTRAPPPRGSMCARSGLGAARRLLLPGRTAGVDFRKRPRLRESLVE